MSIPYKDPVLKKYANLITDTIKIFKEVYYGDPIRIPNSKLPCLILSKSETNVGQLDNAADEHSISILLTVVTDIREEIGMADDLSPGATRLYELIEARDDDYSLKINTILDILRTNINVDVGNNLRTDLGTITHVDYGMTMGKRGPDAYAIEAEITFVAHFSQNR